MTELSLFFRDVNEIFSEYFVASFIYMFFMGASIGSFVNFMAYRASSKLSISDNKSQCDSCGEPLKKRFNIPIFGYCILRGRTNCCGESLSPGHFVTELLFGLIISTYVMTFGVDVNVVISVVSISASLGILLSVFYSKAFTQINFWLLLLCLLAVTDSNNIMINNFMKSSESRLLVIVTLVFLYNYISDKFDVFSEKYKWVNLLVLASSVIINYYLLVLLLVFFVKGKKTHLNWIESFLSFAVFYFLIGLVYLT